MMHDVEMPDYVLERIRAKRGKYQVFDHFDAAKTALLVIDMQNFYVEEVDTAIAIVPNINRIADAVRQAGGVVYWVVMTVANSIDSPSLWPLYHDYFFTPEKGKRVLEIGSAEGGVLKAFVEEGCYCVGIELSENRTKLANEFQKEDVEKGNLKFIAKITLLFTK